MRAAAALLIALLALSPAGAAAQVAEGWEEPLSAPPPGGGEEAPRGGPVIPPANAPPLFPNMESLDKAGEGLKQTGQNIVQVIEKLISAQVFFPARTFQAAVENAATGIVGDMAGDVVESIVEGAKAYIQGSLNIVLSPEVRAMVTSMEWASIPILAIGLAIAALSALAGEAAGFGGGPSSMGQAFLRWLAVALATANAGSLLLLIHNAFAYLTIYVVGSAFGNANTIIDMLKPGVGMGLANYFLLLIVAVIVGLVIAIATFARLAVVAILHVIGPLCIASASLPFGAPIFGQWLTMFVKAELLGVMNGVLMTMGILLTNEIKSNIFMSPLFVLAIFGVLLSLNLSLTKSVFGGVVAVAQTGLRTVGASVGLLAGGVGGVLGGLAAGTAGAAGGGVKPLSGGMGGSGGTATASAAGGSATASGAAGASAMGGAAAASSAAAASGAAVAAAYTSTRGGWQSPVTTVLNAVNAGEARVEGLTAEITARLGIADAAGKAVVAEAVRSGVEVGGGVRISGEQLAQNVRQTAPVIEALVEQFGGRGGSVEVRREEAAAKLGFGNYAEMALALSAYQDAKGGTPQEVVGQTMGAWMQAPPDKTSPLWAGDAPHDYAVGTFISRVAGSSPTRAPLWAKTMGSLRRAFGEQYVADFAKQVASERWDERRVMGEVDAKVASARQSADAVEAALADKVVRFWRPGEARQAGASRGGGRRK